VFQFPKRFKSNKKDTIHTLIFILFLNKSISVTIKKTILSISTTVIPRKLKAFTYYTSFKINTLGTGQNKHFGDEALFVLFFITSYRCFLNFNIPPITKQVNTTNQSCKACGKRLCETFLFNSDILTFVNAIYLLKQMRYNFL